MENIELVHTISNIVIESRSHEAALQKIVTHLCEFLESDVCSIYLLNTSKQKLVLSATRGLNIDAVNRVALGLDEGLTGLAYSTNQYLFQNEASKHSHFKYFPGIGEEPFETFIGIPLKSRRSSIGVLVFQFKAHRENTFILQQLLTTVASIVSAMLVKFDLMETQEETLQVRTQPDMKIKGVALSEGIAIGPPTHVIYSYMESNLEAFDPETEREFLESAFEATISQLKDLIKEIESRNSLIDVGIFHGHLMMLQDKSYKKDMVYHITDHGKGSAFAIRHVTDKFIKRFLSISDPYLNERAKDLEDICQRLLSNLGVLNKQTVVKNNSIIISDILTPGETATMDIDKVSGFVTEKDGATSHTAILARSRNIPAVSGIPGLLELTENVTQMIVDGFEGEVILNPSAEKLKEYQEKQSEYMTQQSQELADDPNLELPEELGVKILANVSSLLDASKAAGFKADGLGLIRTEIFYLQQAGKFVFDRQLAFYQQLVENAPDGPIIFRLLDIGADKALRNSQKEANPALGLRGIRVLLKEKELLGAQVKALLTVHQQRPIRLMAPFITDVDEFLIVKDEISRIAQNMDVDPPLLGAMIEVPSIAFALDDLMKHANFFSIGTNDLFQYFCAVDRNNFQVAYSYSPQFIGFTRLLTQIHETLRPSGKDIEICGEIAADPALLRSLLEIGYRRFSINPYSIRTTRKVIRSWFEKREQG